MVDRTKHWGWRMWAGALALTVVTAAGGCGDDPVDPPVATTITISPGTATFASIGDTVQLSATVQDQYGDDMTDVSVTWTSRDPAVATVTSGGLVTAAGNGATTVEAAVGEAVATATMTTRQQPAEVRVTSALDTLVAIGDTVRLSAEAFDANGHPVEEAAFTWASDDEAVLTVDAAGLVTAAGPGSARVTAATDGVSGGVEVTVDQRTAEVTVTPPTDTLRALGDTARLTAAALDANGHPVAGAEFTWASGDDSVVAVDGTGLAAAVSNGSAEVAASYDDVTGSATITVWQRAADMRMWPLRDTLLAPDTVRLSAEATDANGHLLTNAEFVWSSGDGSVASVDAEGLVRAVAKGSSEVTVTEAGSMLARTAMMWVFEPREELGKLYDALGGPGWASSENWGTDAPLDEWYGVTTDEDGRITELDLSDNGLEGAIPADIGILETLEVLDLGGNGVTRAAPYAPRKADDEGICAFPAYPDPGPQLGAGLTGPIPPGLGTLNRLRVLDLGENSLTGSIPAGLGNLESLEILELGWNNLSGPIPPELGRLADLEVLSLCLNRRRDGHTWVGGLTGSIPAELGELGRLEVLNLYYNQLAGSMPPELAGLQSLQVMDLGVNLLAGPIPPELEDLQELRLLRLHGNRLTDSIPAELADLQNLQVLYLNANQLTGSIPAELGDLQELQVLWLWENRLTGSIPVELGDLRELRDLDLSSNRLNGSIPMELGDLRELRVLNLRANQLTGSIPAELGMLQHLAYLRLADNALAGEIPAELENLTSLSQLWLHDTGLTGTIPDGFVDFRLRLFHWQDTGLCAPDTDTFRDWLASIEDHIGGENCPG
ncbi:MAG: Ig-like domain-containing protein [Gemmatimonadota bacterium]|nr:Ig-like domain-containing protein [Gemmatimonadota bacterium]